MTRCHIADHLGPKLFLDRFRSSWYDRTMSIPTITPAQAAEREQRVAEAIHSGEMEGLDVSAAGRADADEYVAGRIDSDELVARARARYGLAGR